jgi:hypothetical protein
MFQVSTNSILPFIPTSNSWLLHITKICTSKYIGKKLQKQYYSSFHHNPIPQKNCTKDEHKIHYKSLCFSIVENMNPNYSIIPCFVEKNPKQHLKFVLYQNKIYGFLLQVPIAPPTLL